MSENNEIRDDEVISVEPGKESEVKTVEEEIKDLTPADDAVAEEKATEDVAEVTQEEDKKEESEVVEKHEDETEEKVEENKTDEKADTALSEEPSEKKEADDSEKTEDNSEVPPEKQEQKDFEEEGEIPDSEKLIRANQEIQQLRDAEASRQMIAQIQETAAQVEYSIDRFDEGLSKALTDTFKQYNIDLDKTLDELKTEDPAKFAIAQELINHAETIRAQKVAELQAPLIEAQKSFVFKEASKVMCEYDMTDEQADEAATTFVNILNQVGIVDVGEDLKAKVELAVARAKMVKPDVKVVNDKEDKVEDKVEVQVEEIKPEAKVDTVTEKAVEEVKEIAEEVKEKEEVKEEPKADLEAFKEGAAEGDAIVNNREGVTVDNVIQTLNRLPFKQRGAFYKQYEDMIREAGIRNFKNQGLQ